MTNAQLLALALTQHCLKQKGRAYYSPSGLVRVVLGDRFVCLECQELMWNLRLQWRPKYRAEYSEVEYSGGFVVVRKLRIKLPVRTI